MSPNQEKRIQRFLRDLEKLTAQEQFALSHQDTETLSNLNSTKDLILTAFIKTLNEANIDWDAHPDTLTRLRTLEAKWQELDKHTASSLAQLQSEIDECRRAAKKINDISSMYADTDGRGVRGQLESKA